MAKSAQHAHDPSLVPFAVLEAKDRIDSACKALTTLNSLLSSCEAGTTVDADGLFNLLGPIQDNVSQALDELSHVGGGGGLQ